MTLKKCNFVGFVEKNTFSKCSRLCLLNNSVSINLNLRTNRQFFHSFVQLFLSFYHLISFLRKQFRSLSQSRSLLFLSLLDIWHFRLHLILPLSSQFLVLLSLLLNLFLLQHIAYFFELISLLFYSLCMFLVLNFFFHRLLLLSELFFPLDFFNHIHFALVLVS